MGEGLPLTVNGLQTPCYILYKDVLERNARRMLDRAESLGCRLRPHVKTHKTLQAAAICTGGDKRGIVVSTLAEAEFFAAGGFDDIIYAVPITTAKLGAAAALVRRLEAFHISLDHADTLSAVLAQPPAEGKQWSIFLMVDCGYHRDGIDPEAESSVELAQRIVASPVAKLAGLYTHGGHSYDAAGPEVVREVAEQERSAIASFAQKLRAVGVEVPVVGIGSTPTCSNPPSGGLEGVSEMHPGNYCYYDVMQEKLGSCSEEDIAVRVAMRVIGHYPERSMLLIDMGWTACSKQGEKAGYGRIEGHPELRLAELKQEAGIIMPADPEGTLDLSQYPLGMVLRLEPFHSCAHTKQHDRVHVLAEDRQTVADTWRICRGW